MESIWQATCELPARGSLTGNRKVDVVVIGGGMTGILTAYFLKEKGARVLVLEGSRVGSGATGRTTAKVTASHNLIYDRLLTEAGMETARRYGELQELAIAAYAELIREKQIQCHWERRPHYVYTTKDPGPVEREARAARALGMPAEFTERTELPFPVTGAVRFAGQAQFHPLEFLRRIAEEVEVCEHTFVRDVQGHEVQTDRGTVIAGQVVMASHYPFVNVPGWYFLREYQKKSYAAALLGAAKLRGMYIGAGQEGYSLRPYGEYLLFGGEGSRTGKNKDGMGRLLAAAQEWYPESRAAYAWVNQDGMTLDGMPYVGRYARKSPYLYVASGYGKWGMTQSMAAALLLSKELAGETWEYTGTFDPGRRFRMATLPAFLGHGAESARGLFTGLFMPGRAHLHKCSHLGCKLTWNAKEQVYECPCHGSRFDKDGKRLAGPARKGMK